MHRLISAEYNHIKFYNRIFTMKGLIWGLWGGLVLGLLISYYHKSYLGEVVRRLLKKEAHSPESAKTLEELGVKNTFALRHALKEGATLRRHVEVANPGECLTPRAVKKRSRFAKLFLSEKQKYDCDFDKMKLYIPEEKRISADLRYAEKRHMSPAWLIFFIVLFAALAVGAMIVIPDLLRMLDNFLTMNSD